MSPAPKTDRPTSRGGRSKASPSIEPDPLPKLDANQANPPPDWERLESMLASMKGVIYAGELTHWPLNFALR